MTAMWFEHTIVSILNRFTQPRRRTPSQGLILGTSLGDQAGVVVWPTVKRPEHLCVVGKTGSGKTHCMEWLASQLMNAGEPFVFLDYHGDATNHLLALAADHPEGRERTLLVDLTDATFSPGLNPLEATAGDDTSVFGRSSELASILRQRWQVDAFGPRTEELLRNTLFVLSASGCTLVEAPLLLTSRAFRTALVSSINNPDVLDYWTQRYEPLSEPMKAAFREPLLNKITGFLTESSCRHLLGQQRSTFTFRQAIEEGRWVLVNLAKGHLREHAHTLGNLIFARLQFEVLARAGVPETQRRLFTVFCDEVQNLCENDLTLLLAEGRKFRVSLVTGHQYWEQLPKELRGALLSAGTHLFFQLSAADASVLSSELSVEARHRYHRELTALPRGHAIARVGSTSPVALTVPKLPQTRHAVARVATLRASAIARHSRRRQEVEAEIRGRRRTAIEPSLTDLTTHEHDDLAGQQGW